VKRLAGTTLAILFLGLFLSFGPGVAAASSQNDGETPSRLRLDIAQMNPRWVTGTSSTLNITGTVTNTGDRKVSDIAARIQLGERQTTDRQLRASMAEAPPTDSAQSKFADVTRSLDPGQTAPLNITVRLDNTPGALQFARTGVYPLLVNVNGTPEYGGPARLASLSMLVPVLSVPGKDPAGQRPPKPTPVSLLWPISDTRPHVVDAPFGGPTVLADDQLADDLAPGGRLDGLVSAAQSAETDPRVGSALCFAVDPDLLDTITAMGQGYQVRTPAGLVPGRGVEAANRWMGSLTRLVKGRCVVRMPYGDASLAALSKLRDSAPELTRSAIDTGAHVKDLLGIEPLAGVLWPGGSMDGSTLGRLPDAGVKTLITDPANLQSGSQVTSGVGIAGTTLRAQPSDSLVAAAFGGGSTKPDPAASGSITPADDPDIETQNGLAALAYRAGLGGTTSAQSSAKPLLITPPRHWAAPAAEMTRMVEALGEYVNRGMISPEPFQQLLATPTAGTTSMSYTAQDIAAEPPGEVTGQLAGVDSATLDLQNAMAVDPTAQVSPDQVLKPVRDGVLRASSDAWQGNATAQRAAASDARFQLDGLRGRVTVAPPGQVISLASGSSPLPVFISNGLPVSVTVRTNLNNNTGLRPGPIPDVVVPARGALNTLVQTEALRSGRFTVDVALSTPGGTQLGPSATFELRSNEYGTVTVIVTASAAGALVLLSGRRIYRRIRGRKAA
jgi:hypothetical protein